MENTYLNVIFHSLYSLLIKILVVILKNLKGFLYENRKNVPEQGVT